MAWEDRIKDGVYQSPSGVRITFDFENVSRRTTKKAAIFEYPQRPGARVQDLEIGARYFPMRMYLHGSDYDIDSNRLYNALEEPGIGILEHPLYGTFNVFPTSLERIDGLKDAGGQAVFNVEFVENNLDPSPAATTDERSAIVSLADQFATEGPLAVEGIMEDATPTGLQLFSTKVQEVSRFVNTHVRPVMVAAGIDTQTFDRINRNLRIGTNIASGDVRTVTAQLNTLIRAGTSASRGGPAAYINLADALINTQIDGPEQFSLVSFAAESTVSAMTLSTGATAYETRGEAVADSDALVDAATRVVDWQDTNG